MKPENDILSTPGSHFPGFKELIFEKEIPPITIKVNWNKKTVRFVISRHTMTKMGVVPDADTYLALFASTIVTQKQFIMTSATRKPSSRRLVACGTNGAVTYPWIREFQPIIPPGAVSCVPRIEVEGGRMVIDLAGVTWERPKPPQPKPVPMPSIVPTKTPQLATA